MSDGNVSQVTWSALDYDALPLPHEEWGRRLVEALPLSGAETVVDIGAGTGRDAALVLTRLPRGQVICLDGSPQMRARCSERFAAEPRVRVEAVDLRGTWPLEPASVDAVMSVATLHWLEDHDVIFSEAARCLRSGGVLRVDCGGAGNIAEVLAAVDSIGASDALPTWYYADAEASWAALQAAGFDVRDARLREAPAYFENDDVFRAYLHKIVLHRLTAEQIDAVAAKIPTRCVDYVRLEIDAARAN